MSGLLVHLAHFGEPPEGEDREIGALTLSAVPRIDESIFLEPEDSEEAGIPPGRYVVRAIQWLWVGMADGFTPYPMRPELRVQHYPIPETS